MAERESQTPNFSRSTERAATFERHYVGSLPCMLRSAICKLDINSDAANRLLGTVVERSTPWNAKLGSSVRGAGGLCLKDSVQPAAGETAGSN